MRDAVAARGARARLTASASPSPGDGEPDNPTPHVILKPREYDVTTNLVIATPTGTLRLVIPDTQEVGVEASHGVVGSGVGGTLISGRVVAADSTAPVNG